MVQTVHHIIREAILGTKTALDMGFRTDKEIIVYEYDWPRLAQIVTEALNNPNNPRRLAELPQYEKVLFLVKKLGENNYYDKSIQIKLKLTLIVILLLY